MKILSRYMAIIPMLCAISAYSNASSYQLTNHLSTPIMLKTKVNCGFRSPTFVNGGDSIEFNDDAADFCSIYASKVGKSSANVAFFAHNGELSAIPDKLKMGYDGTALIYPTLSNVIVAQKVFHASLARAIIKNSTSDPFFNIFYGVGCHLDNSVFASYSLNPNDNLHLATDLGQSEDGNSCGLFLMGSQKAINILVSKARVNESSIEYKGFYYTDMNSDDSVSLSLNNNVLELIDS